MGPVFGNTLRGTRHFRPEANISNLLGLCQEWVGVRIVAYVFWGYPLAREAWHVKGNPVDVFSSSLEFVLVTNANHLCGSTPGEAYPLLKPSSRPTREPTASATPICNDLCWILLGGCLICLVCSVCLLCHWGLGGRMFFILLVLALLVLVS